MGTCRFADTTVVCGGPTCTNDTTLSVSRCNGTGMCGSAMLTMCGGNLKCSSNMCPAMCTMHSQCTTGFCDTGTGMCAKKPLGTMCGGNGECDSGFCADGVCCNVACNQPCQACSAAGMCGDVKNAPDDMCPNETATNPCGRTGCNGASMCRYADTNVVCAQSCSADMTTLNETRCNGTGMCANMTSVSCSTMEPPRVCMSNACVVAP
jgi:hypothetical protein